MKRGSYNAKRVSTESISERQISPGTVKFEYDTDDVKVSVGGGRASIRDRHGVGRVGRATVVGAGKLQGQLHRSNWYALLQERTRMVLKGKPFVALMIIALLIALFLPDSCILWSVKTNLGRDLTLSMVMLLFAFEFVALSLVDATYFLSFFWFMDIVGTMSLIFDISFFLGPDAGAPRTADGGNAKKNLMLLRAARAARIGARAGRLSRLLRMVRFLPCFVDEQDKTKGSKNRGIAVVISSQLANSVATRVACLTILLVMVIPLFDIMSFPQNDYSLQTWVLRLSVSYTRKDKDGFNRELNQMVHFFKDDSYGPYTACHGYAADDGAFVCEEHIPDTDWQPQFREPIRLASALLVHSDSFMVGFNMDEPTKFEAKLAVWEILFIVSAMVGSGLALSSVVTDLAVRPLERMLLTVRQIASTVFKFSRDVEEEDELNEAEVYDVDGTSEMELLEKVVEKLAVVAQLQTKSNMDRTEDMRDEDIGILSMMEGKNVTRDSRLSSHGLNIPQTRRKVMTPSKALEDIGVSQEVYMSLAFNILPLSKSQGLSIAFFTIAHFHAPGDGFVRTQEEKATLKRFINAAEKEYKPNPFHNFFHAVDCVHMVARLMRKMASDDFLTELEQFALLVAGISHDLGHPGVNNGFLSETSHELALKYNDRSPLENLHCSKLYQVVADEEANVFAKLSREQYKEVRKNCVETILHTDMMSHQSIVKDLQMTYQMNSEAFTASPADLGNPESRSAELDVFNQPSTKVLIMNNLLHSADVSNPCRTWETASAWGFKVIEEFFAQGDEERRLGIPVQFLNDRDKLNKPNSQIGFIEFMIAPYFFAQIKLWPALGELGDELVVNLAKWEEMWQQEVNPSEEEKHKVSSRVAKVLDNLEEAKKVSSV